MTQLPWDTETRAAHLHAIPIPRHCPKWLEEGFSLLSRNRQFENVLFFFFLSQRFHLGSSPSRIIPLCLPSFLPMDPSAHFPLHAQLTLLCILFCQVCHCSTLSNKPSGGGRRFPSSTLVAEKSFPCPGPPSPVGVCVHKNRGSRDLWLAEPTCPHSGAAPFPLFQQLQFPEQGWLPWKHHLHTSPKSLQQPKLPLLNPAPNTSLDRGTSPAQDSDSQ